MNTKIQEHIDSVLESIGDSAKSQARVAATVAVAGLIMSKIEEDLSDTVYLNAYGGSIWFDVYNREDLQKIMVISPLWNKSAEGDAINYTSTVQGVNFRIKAHDAALPDTCKIIEEEIIVPAVPEHTCKVTRVQCNQPVEAAL
jgi:hypothetical protein